MLLKWDVDYSAGMKILWGVAVVVLALLNSVHSQAQTAAPETQSETDSGPAAPAMCATGSVGERQKGKDRYPSYIEDSFSQLKTEVPALRALKFEADQSLEPAKSADILSQTGAAITAMIPRVPNLIAKEELAEASVPLPYVVQETQVQNGGNKRNAAALYDSSSHNVQGEELQKVLDGMLTAGKHPIFSYRIQSSPDPKYGTVLSEYRTNSENESVDVSNLSPGNPRGVGFSSSWLIFKPANAPQSQYRYLGREKVGKHDTAVVAFAQIPGEVLVPAQISVGGGTCSYLMQGLVWIDDSIFQIVKVQTDLLAPLSGIHVNLLRSVVSFGEVRIPERNLTLWMPSEVEIRWEMKDQVGEERHKYTDYRLFGATSRIVLP